MKPIRKPNTRLGSVLPLIGAAALMNVHAAIVADLDTRQEYNQNFFPIPDPVTGVPVFPGGDNDWYDTSGFPPDQLLNPHGHTNGGGGAYTITAGGVDFWGGTDSGTFIYKDGETIADGENFSAIVRSDWVAQDLDELLAGEWGRTGILAKTDPTSAPSANVGHFRKSGGNAFTMLQGRNTAGAGTDRNGGEFNNAAANTANGSVRETPIWLGLHRLDGTWYATWAPDVAGVPGEWSTALARPGTPETTGEMTIGLAHQSHWAVRPEINTASFSGFEIDTFNPAWGVFATDVTYEISFTGTSVFLTASGDEIGNPNPQDVDWKIEFYGDDVYQTGLKADIYLSGNSDANRNALRDNTLDQVLGAPAGSIVIPNINWSNGGGVKYPDEHPLPDENGADWTDNTLGSRNLFNEAVPSRAWTGDEADYGVHLTGEIHIPSLAARDGREVISIHDGNDDYTFVEIDGIRLHSDNDWANWDGTGNGGAHQWLFSAPIGSKYDDGEWVTFRYGMWEGGGGDHANLVWNALDRQALGSTGVDPVTGGADLTANTYLGNSITNNAKLDFVNDATDQIPTQNLRTLIPGLEGTDEGSGQPSTLQLTNSLKDTTITLRVYMNGQLVGTIPALPHIADANFTGYEEATIQIMDVGTGGTRDVDTSTLVVTRDGFPITPTITKVGQTTIIVDSFAPEPYTDYTYVIMGTTTAATGLIPIELSASATSFPFREEMRAGLGTPPNATTGWDYHEFDVANALGGNLDGADRQAWRDALEVIEFGLPDTAEEPFINHRDPQNSPNPSGDWAGDRPIVSNTTANDDQFVTYARTIVTIAPGEEGDYTFSWRGDDGWGMRITGTSGEVAEAIAVYGDGDMRIHPVETTSAFLPSYGDSNARAVFNFPVAGDYLIEFVGFEGGGGAHMELAWAPGHHDGINDTIGWSLVGDMSQFTPGTSVYGTIPASVIPPLSTETGFGHSTRWWYQTNNPAVDNLGQVFEFLRDVDTSSAEFSAFTEVNEEFINHADDGGGGGVFGGNVPYPGDPDGGGTDRIVMIDHMRVVAPSSGDYTLQVRSDDGFMLRWVNPNNTFHSFDSGGGAGRVHPNAPSEAFFPNGTGDANTRASVFLTAGTHDLIMLWWEGGGGSHVELSAAPGVVLDHASPPFELLSTGDNMSAGNLYLSTGEFIAGAPVISNISVLGSPPSQVTFGWTGGTATVDVLRGTTLTDFVKIGESSTGSFTDNAPPAPAAQYRVRNQ